MGIHDWTRVSASTFYDFHHVWIAELRQALNRGLLPEGYYAQAEQVATEVVPDVLTLQDLSDASGEIAPDTRTASTGGENGGIAVAIEPPRVAVCDVASEAMLIAARRRQLVIRHATGDRIVALLEIVSPGNKEKRGAIQQFVDKAIGALDEGYHLQVIDLFPPGTFDPTGIHGAIWRRLGGTFEPPGNKPLTLAAYMSKGAVTCYVEPVAVGGDLIPMPLFLDPGHYVNVPLESTYDAAYGGVAKRWKRVIEATP